MVKVIPIASGKGGVGKSVLSVNLGVSLSQMKRTTVLIDLDLGGANLHTLLGIKNNNQGIGSLISKERKHINEIIQPTKYDKLHFVLGDSFTPSAANIHYFLKNKIMKEVQEIVADYVILDLGAGTSFNVIDFFLINPRGILVVSPQLTSMLNTFGFLKNAVFRLLYGSFAPKSQEREIIKQMLVPHKGKHKSSFFTVMEELENHNLKSRERVETALKKFQPQIVCNMLRKEAEIHYLKQLKMAAKKHLDLTLEQTHFLPYDEQVDLSILRRTPMVLDLGQSEFSKSLLELSHILS